MKKGKLKAQELNSVNRGLGMHFLKMIMLN